MTENPLVKKLRLQAGMRAAFVNAPAGYVASLGLPDAVVVIDRSDTRADFIQLFVRDSMELKQHIDTVLGAIGPESIVWFCYPKQRSGIQTDLTRDVGWQAVEDAGWRGVASIAIDETWSGVRFRPGEYPTGNDAFAAQYGGAKAALRPIYERVLAEVQGFGDDVELQTRQTYVAFARGKQFAAVQPSTRTRVDVGLKLPGVAAGGRLEAGAIGGGAMTHKVAVRKPEEVDDELIAWLRAAYDGAS